ncbi:transglutaminase family protein [Chloroflexota bacterium]
MIIKGTDNPIDRAIALFYAVRDGVRYNPYVNINDPEQYKASRVLQMGEGYCVQKAVLLCALARAAGIPARLGFVDIKNYRMPDKLFSLLGTNHVLYHGYAALCINGIWVKATPAFNLEMCQDLRLPPVEFDGYRDALFSDRDLDGKPFIEYVNYRGFFDDVPLDAMLQEGNTFYGTERMSFWDKSSDKT